MARDTFILTCWSCMKYRMGGCLDRVRGWPNLGPGRCDGFDYQPGSDERERPPDVRVHGRGGETGGAAT
jgi:hypothetical protein